MKEQEELEKEKQLEDVDNFLMGNIPQDILDEVRSKGTNKTGKSKQGMNLNQF